MSKMSELDLIAQGVADHMKELLYDTVEWQIAEQPVDGDDYNALHSMVMNKAIEYLYKQNNITNR
jgi:thiamine biosynthesis protein ThiC